MVEDIRKVASFEARAMELVQKKAKERGVSLAEFLNSRDGVAQINEIVRAKTQALQTDRPLGDGYHAALLRKAMEEDEAEFKASRQRRERSFVDAQSRRRCALHRVPRARHRTRRS